MKRLLCLACLGLGATASAHIKLLSPTEWIVTDALGDPQKQGPCGSTTGTPSGVVTTVEAGSTLTVRWQETILHPGHFRLALTADRSQLVDPVATVTNGVCVSAAVESPPVPPVLADGLFEHTQASPTGTWETTITVPNTPCDACTLQLVQFMAQHGAPCFYYHCADLRIVAPDGGAPDAGAEVDAGADLDGGSAVDGGSAADGGSAVDGGAGGDGGPPATGCGCAAGGGAGALFPLALLALAGWRRRARSSALRRC